jgi:hypothetical protein
MPLLCRFYRQHKTGAGNCQLINVKRLRRWAKAALLFGIAGFLLAHRGTPYERAIRNRQSPVVFRSEAGRERYGHAYAAMLSRWPVPAESIYIPTRFGQTHILAAGPVGAPAVILLHAAGVSATEWYDNVAPLSEHFRLYALDTVGDCGRYSLSAALIRFFDPWLSFRDSCLRVIDGPGNCISTFPLSVLSPLTVAFHSASPKSI